jgi:hypothetical protein
MKYFILCLFLIASVVQPVFGLENEKFTVAQPVDTRTALVNPQMGWVFHYYDNSIRNYGSRLEPSDTVDDFPGLAVIYLRIPWSYLEPEEGKFNWSYVDIPAQRWIDKGKRIAFRFTVSESVVKYATPKWVQDAGAKGYFFKGGQIVKDGPYWEPDFGNPIFLGKLENFLKAVAERYDGNPNVDFIDVGSLGVWGEGHTYASTRKNYPFEVLKKHIDLHLKYFKHTLLIANDDFSYQELDYSDWQEILKTDLHKLPPKSRIIEYARQKGLSLRDDSILVLAFPRHYFRQDMAQLFWLNLPVIIESEHYGSSKRNNAWGDGSMYLQAVEDYHASYASIHWWPREFLNEQIKIIDEMNMRMGYRLFPVEISWQSEMETGKPFEFTMKWSNKGVAPCYPGGFITITMKDEKGGITGVFVNQSFNVRSLAVSSADNPSVQEVKSVFSFPENMPKGNFDVYVSVGKNDGTPVIAMSLPDNDGQRRYKIGKITVK